MRKHVRLRDTKKRGDKGRFSGVAKVRREMGRAKRKVKYDGEIGDCRGQVERMREQAVI